MFNASASTWLAGVVFGLIFYGPAAQAEAVTNSAAPGNRIEINTEECTDQIGLIATNVMLSDVLQALAAHLQFELNFKSDKDRTISVDLQKPGRELIESLGRDDNIMISSELDARCDEPVDRLAAVWFLGTGPEITYRPVKAARVDQLPETGAVQARSTRSTEADDKEGERKRRKDMTPEERYVDKLERKNRKNQKHQDIE